ncbi:MAG: hypothetical protein ACLFTK_00870 [Anaerolineales bacterium]
MAELPENDFPEEPFALQIPPDLAPEDALQVVVGLCYEMRHPLGKINALAGIIQDPTTQHAQCHAAAGEIQQWIGGIRYILNIIYAYDEYHAATDETGTDTLP